MRRVSPRTQFFAERLIAHEAKVGKSSATNLAAAFLVCEKLRPNLTPLTGAAGFQTLLSRAHALAIADVPRLTAVRINADGSVARVDEFESHSGSKVDFAGDGGLLVSHLLGLLVAFIGEGLTEQLINEAWPQFLPGDLHSAQAPGNEKPNDPRHAVEHFG